MPVPAPRRSRSSPPQRRAESRGTVRAGSGDRRSSPVGRALTQARPLRAVDPDPSGLASPVIASVTALPAPSLSEEQKESLCSVIGLVVKIGLVSVVGVSLVRLAAAYQDRMERQGELAAVLDIEKAKLHRARERFDQLFSVDGEQRLIREQDQWIAPNRLRIVWQSPAAFPSVEQPSGTKPAVSPVP